MAFTLPDLPFGRDALGDFMSAETLAFHHGKHHRTYVDKVNESVGDERLQGASLSQVIRAAQERQDSGLLSNGGQFWNHNFFWQCLAPPEGQRPAGRLTELIDEEFGSTDRLLKAIEAEAAAHFGSGWAWLVLDRGKLRISSLHDGDTPVAHDGMQPLFTIDVWEHAYYIDYRNDRPKFVGAVLGNLVNWDFVARNLDGGGVGRADQPG